MSAVGETPGQKATESINHKPVEQENNQAHKGCYITAIVIGILFVLGGIIGFLGMFQSHYHFLPPNFDWLALPIEFFGNTPGVVGLWGIAASVVGVLGVVAIGFGSARVHQIRRAEEYKSADGQPIEALLGENFDLLELNPENFKSLEKKIYGLGTLGKGTGEQFVPINAPKNRFVVARTSEGTLQCTGRITLEQQVKLEEYLVSKQYTLYRHQ